MNEWPYMISKISYGIQIWFVGHIPQEYKMLSPIVFQFQLLQLNLILIQLSGHGVEEG